MKTIKSIYFGLFLLWIKANAQLTDPQKTNTKIGAFSTVFGAFVGAGFAFGLLKIINFLKSKLVKTPSAHPQKVFTEYQIKANNLEIDKNKPNSENNMKKEQLTVDEESPNKDVQNTNRAALESEPIEENNPIIKHRPTSSGVFPEEVLKSSKIITESSAVISSSMALKPAVVLAMVLVSGGVIGAGLGAGIGFGVK